jgi:hypothetical protein
MELRDEIADLIGGRMGGQLTGTTALATEILALVRERVEAVPYMKPDPDGVAEVARGGIEVKAAILRALGAP